MYVQLIYTRPQIYYLKIKFFFKFFGTKQLYDSSEKLKKQKKYYGSLLFLLFFLQNTFSFCIRKMRNSSCQIFLFHKIKEKEKLQNNLTSK
jgi:hypothetical protein